MSVSNAEGPPVPIPNTEVKLCSAENTCLATDRENRSMLTYNRQTAKVMPVKDSCSDNCRGDKSVILTQRVHPFPFRTRKLSSAVPKILIWRRIGKIGHCRHIIRETPKCFPCNHSTQYSSLAQLVRAPDC